MATKGRPPKNAKLPDWFDIRKYKTTKAFRAKEWFQQLYLRQAIFDRIPPNEDPASYQVTYGEELWKVVRKNPVDNYKILAQSDFIYLYDLDFRTPDAIREFAGITTASIRDVVSAYRGLPKYFQKNDQVLDRAVFAQVLTDPQSGRSSHDAFGEIDPYQPNEILLKINMNMPDSLLGIQFDDTLRHLRSQIKPGHKWDEKPFPSGNSIPFASWFKSGLLPYFDLKIWSKKTGGVFTAQQFADLLSELHGKDGEIWISEDAVRRTSEGHFKSVLFTNVIDILLAQAASEQALQKPPSSTLRIKRPKR